MTDHVEHAATQAQSEEQAALVALLRAHAKELREHGVTSLAIFGSRARGDERSDSDLDVLITYDTARPFTLYDLVRVKHVIEGVTGLDVHVSTQDGFPEHQLRRVLKNAATVF